MSEKDKILAAEVSALWVEADCIDQAHDAEFGKNRRGDELPEQWRRRASRRAKIGQAKAAVEEQASQRAREHAEATSRGRGDDADTIASKGVAAAKTATPKPTAQRNFTDPVRRSCSPATARFTSATTPKPWSTPITR